MDELFQTAMQFEIEGQPVQVQRLGNGHLHKTYLLTTQGAYGLRQYVLQDINTKAFRKPAVMMENIQRVTCHIHKTLEMQGCEDIRRKVLSFVPTREGMYYLPDYLGRSWRMYHYIDHCYTIDVPQNLRQIYEGAKAFGQFLRNVANLPGEPLKETLHDFHNGMVRFERFEQAVGKKEFGQAEAANDQIELIRENAWVFKQMEQMIQSGALPQRTTHNDTKINNVLLDTQTHKAMCVIDLDTVMPGVAAYDFGDLVRTAAVDSAEDEQDLSRVGIRLPQFEAIVKGYFEGTGGVLTDAEKESLMAGARMIPLIMATRFLTDFLEGDWYFATHRPRHNLDRCRAQLALFKSILEMDNEMRKIVNA